MDKLTEWLSGERGRLKLLAEKCGITHSAVWQWSRVPPGHIVTVESVTGIPREELRPDLYRQEPAGASQ